MVVNLCIQLLLVYIDAQPVLSNHTNNTIPPHVKASTNRSTAGGVPQLCSVHTMYQLMIQLLAVGKKRIRFVLETDLGCIIAAWLYK